MKYRLNTTNYHDFATFAVNKLPARSYFIPYPGRAAADAVAPKQKRYASPKVQCLNGEWDFKFYPRPAELPVELDTDVVHFDKLDVPSCLMTCVLMLFSMCLAGAQYAITELIPYLETRA